MDRNEEERMMAFIEKQVVTGRQNISEETNDELTPLIRTEDEPLVLNMKLKPKLLPATLIKHGILGKRKEPSENEPISEIDNESNSSKIMKREKSPSIESIIDDNVKCSTSKRKSNVESEKKHKGWLRNGLIVKIMTKKIGEKYYKAKGVIMEIVDDSFYVGKIKINSPENVEGHILKIDQEHLETVIPAIGREVIILKGKHIGEIVTIKKVRIEDFCVDIELKTGSVLKRIPYEEICKFDKC